MPLAVSAAEQQAHGAIGEGGAGNAGSFRVGFLRQIGVHPFQRAGALPALARRIQGQTGADIGIAADAAFDLVGGDRFIHIHAADKLRGQHIQGKLPADIAPGGQRTAVQGYLGKIHRQAANLHELAAQTPFGAVVGGPRCAAARAIDGDTGDALQGLGHVFVGKFADILGDDGIDHVGRFAFYIQPFAQTVAHALDHDLFNELSA